MLQHRFRVKMISCNKRKFFEGGSAREGTFFQKILSLAKRRYMTQNRFKSKVVWAAVAAQVLAILVALGVIDTGLSEALNGLCMSLLQVLVAFGILNNPTDQGGF